MPHRYWPTGGIVLASSAACCLWLAVCSSTTVALAAEAPSPQMAGLRNLGNTCYINAQLQCAYHIPLVRRLILNPPSVPVAKEENDDDDDDDSSPAEESPGLTALRSVFVDMTTAATQHQRTVSPVSLTRTLGIPVWEQQDSQEFWKLLLPTLRLPALTDLYQGAFEAYIVAQDGTGRERRREEAFLDISLDIHEGDSVESGLTAAFGQPEWLRVAEGNGWRPAKGADKVDALKGSQLRAQGLPAILQLHLKRFTYDWNRDVMEKANGPVRFSDTLNLRAWVCPSKEGKDSDDDDDNDCYWYDLQGVVIHVGEFNAGHYYAYVRPRLDENRWFRINDDLIDEVTFEEVLQDAIGGRVKTKQRARRRSRTQPKNFLQRLVSRLQGNGEDSSSRGSYGFGGPTSNAYVLQYVRRSDRNRLYPPSS